LLISTLVITLCILGWTSYVNGYNNENGNHQNLIGIYPIWQMDHDLLHYTIIRIITQWSHAFQQWMIHFFYFSAFLFMLLSINFIPFSTFAYCFPDSWDNDLCSSLV